MASKILKKAFLSFILAILAISFQVQTEAQAADSTVYYATTRLNEGTGARPVYGTKRHLDLGHGSIEYGKARVKEPTGLPSLEQSPDWTTYKTRMKICDTAWQAAPIDSVKALDQWAFFKEIASWRGTIVVFLHGYDETFEDSLRDAAVIANELEKRDGRGELPVKAVLFSWPSQGKTTDYSMDEANLEWSQAPFREFIGRLATARPPETALHVVAHSLGSRLAFGLTDDLRSYSAPPLTKLLFSSSDYDFHQAMQRKDLLERLVEKDVFILVSDRDGPLITSQLLHGSPRLGRPIDPPPVSRKPQDYTKKTFWKQILNEAADMLITDDTYDPPQVSSWLERQAGRDIEFANRTRFFDVSEIVTADLGHRLAWPVVGSLLSVSQSLYPLSTRVVHKQPDKAIMEQCNGKPAYLFRFHRIAQDRFGLRQ